jgi:hypothetical protein
MATPPPESDQSSSQQDPPAGEPPGESRKRKLGKLTGAPALIIISGVAAFIIGITIGNAARKRMDKWAHAYQ